MRLTIALIFCAVHVLPLVARAQDRVAWRTGDDFRRQLQVSFGVRWASQPLRPALRSVARFHGTAVWLDRRIDPGQPVDLDVEAVALDRLLRGLASSQGIGVSYVDSVVYFGPTELTSTLATVAAIKREQAARFEDPSVSRSLLKRQAWQWEALTTPRELLDGLAEEADIPITNADVLPHDLWSAGDFPRLALTDRLSLLLAGFGLTYGVDADGPAITLQPFPETVSLERAYTPRGDIEVALTQLSRMFPDLSIQRRGKRIIVTGLHEEHEAVVALLRGDKPSRPRPSPAPAGRSKFDLRVENKPAQAVISLLSEREQLAIRATEDVREKLKERVSLTVRDATVEELLRATLKPLGIGFKLEASTVTLSLEE